MRQAKKAFVKQDLEKVVEILEGKLVDSDDPRLQKLLNDAKIWIAKIQQLSQQLNLAWKKQDTEQLTQIANKILRIQPSHIAANEALRWADSVLKTVKPVSLVKPEKKNFHKEWILQKYFFLSTSIFIVAILLFSVFIYHHFATSESKPESLGRNLSEVASVKTTDKQQEITKQEEVKLPSQQTELKPAIYNVENRSSLCNYNISRTILRHVILEQLPVLENKDKLYSIKFLKVVMHLLPHPVMVIDLRVNGLP